MEYLNFSSTTELTLAQANGTGSNRQVGSAVLLGLCCLMGLPCNSVVIISIVHQWNRYTNLTVKLMLNLALSDSLTLGLVPFAVYYMLYGWTFDSWFCKLLTYLSYTAMHVSVLTVTTMAVHHYHAVRSKVPNRNELERLRKNRLNLLLIGIWGLALVTALPTVFNQAVLYKRGSLRCLRMMDSDFKKVTILLLELIFGFVLPSSIILVSYCWINKTMSQRGQTMKKRNKRMRMLVISIVTAFFLFWTPVHIINVIDIITTLTKTSLPTVYTHLKSFRRATGDLSKIVAVISCCVNPFLYAFASGTLKKKRNHHEENRTASST